MSLAELQQSVLALPEKERHEFFRWMLLQEQDYGDVDPEAVAQIVSEYWAEEEKSDATNKPKTGRDLAG